MTLGGSQLLGEEAKECRTVKLGERVVRSYHKHAILGNPERTGRSWTDSQSVIVTRGVVVTVLHRNMLV